MPKKTMAQLSSGQSRDDRDEWYTPQFIIDRVKLLFGGVIDLDPASCEWANRNINARKIFTIQENGLFQEWCGKTFVNPPYGRFDNAKGYAGLFASKFVSEYKAGRLTEGVGLFPINATAAYFWLFYGVYPVCFLREKVMFKYQGVMRQAHMSGTQLVYLGNNPGAFIRHFGDLGLVAVPQNVYGNICEYSSNLLVL